MDILVRSSRMVPMRERLKGNNFLSWLGSFLFHGVLTNVPIETPEGGALSTFKPGYDGSCPLSPNSKVTIKQEYDRVAD